MEAFLHFEGKISVFKNDPINPVRSPGNQYLENFH